MDATSTAPILVPVDRSPVGSAPAEDRAPERSCAADRWSVVAGLAVLGATAVGLRWAGRPPAVRTITMGPGGWVSFKNARGRRPRRAARRRPWWAVLLRAERLG